MKYDILFEAPHGAATHTGAIKYDILFEARM